MMHVNKAVSYQRLGGTVWRSQGVALRYRHGLPAAPVDRATHR